MIQHKTLGMWGGRAARAFGAGMALFLCGSPQAYAVPAMSVSVSIDALMTFARGSTGPDFTNQVGYQLLPLDGGPLGGDYDSETNAPASVAFDMPLVSGGASASGHHLQLQGVTAYPDLLVSMSATTYAGLGHDKILIAPHSGIAVIGKSTIDVTGYTADDGVTAISQAFLDIYGPRGYHVLTKKFVSELQSGGHLADSFELQLFNAGNYPLYASYTSYISVDALLAAVPEIGTREMTLLGTAGLGALGWLGSRRRRFAPQA